MYNIIWYYIILYIMLYIMLYIILYIILYYDLLSFMGRCRFWTKELMGHCHIYMYILMCACLEVVYAIFTFGSEGNFTSRMVNYFEWTKGLHYIIGPAGELNKAVGITLHQWPVQKLLRNYIASSACPLFLLYIVFNILSVHCV